jgi:hypothetical protein
MADEAPKVRSTDGTHEVAEIPRSIYTVSRQAGSF